MTELHLKVYVNKSELVRPDGTIEIFLEGPTSGEAKRRYQKIKTVLENGYLETQIIRCQTTEASELGFLGLKDDDIALIERMVSSIMSEVGRALVALTIMQLCVKAIEPEQSIRLHKSSGGTYNFSWKEGISMRSLDKLFITPTLRKYDLLRLNADGFMMTRSLAENYPYSGVYKAQIRGARNEWLRIVERVENGNIKSEIALCYLLSQLLNRAEQFIQLSNSMLESLTKFSARSSSDQVYQVIIDHINRSDYAARLMEVAMHSLMQAMGEAGMFAGGELIPLSQMRSANKKHGNIGDIEIMQDKQIIEAWDAKYGKNYLRDEIEELTEKLVDHPDIKIAGFVTSEIPDRLQELLPRIGDIQDLYGVELKILHFGQWVKNRIAAVVEDQLATEQDISRAWLTAYGESLAQRRRYIAPIDEPCHKWVESLKAIIDGF